MRKLRLAASRVLGWRVAIVEELPKLVAASDVASHFLAAAETALWKVCRSALLVLRLDAAAAAALDERLQRQL